MLQFIISGLLVIQENHYICSYSNDSKIASAIQLNEGGKCS